MTTHKSPPPAERSDALDEKIIDLLSEGRFVEDACKELGITRQRLQVWRRDDPDFDARVWSAIGAGIWFQRERILKLMHETAETAGRHPTRGCEATRPCWTIWAAWPSSC